MSAWISGSGSVRARSGSSSAKTISGTGSPSDRAISPDTSSAMSARAPWPAPRNLSTYIPSSSAATMAGSDPPSRSGVTYRVTGTVRRARIRAIVARVAWAVTDVRGSMVDGRWSIRDGRCVGGASTYQIWVGGYEVVSCENPAGLRLGCSSLTLQSPRDGPLPRGGARGGRVRRGAAAPLVDPPARVAGNRVGRARLRNRNGLRRGSRRHPGLSRARGGSRLACERDDDHGRDASDQGLQRRADAGFFGPLDLHVHAHARRSRHDVSRGHRDGACDCSLVRRSGRRSDPDRDRYVLPPPLAAR